MKVLLIMIGVLLTQLVVAEEIKPAERTIIETWKCYAISDRSQKNALVHLTREHQLSVIHALAGSKLEVGTVSVAGTKYTQYFKLTDLTAAGILAEIRKAMSVGPIHLLLSQMEMGVTTISQPRLQELSQVKSSNV